MWKTASKVYLEKFLREEDIANNAIVLDFEEKRIWGPVGIL